MIADGPFEMGKFNLFSMKSMLTPEFLNLHPSSTKKSARWDKFIHLSFIVGTVWRVKAVFGEVPIYNQSFPLNISLSSERAVESSSEISMSKESRFLGFKKEICVKDGSSWSDQTFTVRAKFEVRTLTGLEDLIYEVKRVFSWQ